MGAVCMGFLPVVTASGPSWDLLERVQAFVQMYHYEELEKNALLEGAVDGALKAFDVDEEEGREALLQEGETISLQELIDRMQSFFPDYYTEELGEEELIYASLRGMVGALDIYSSFMTPDSYEELQREIEGEYGGIGVIITIREDKITVVSSFDGTPGGNADIKPGDIIRYVNETSTEGMSVDAVANRIRGPEDTKVTLTLYRESEDREFEIELTRAIVEIPYVEHELLEGDIGYISITQFYNDVGRKVQGALRELKHEGAQSFILDLRNNPGGILQEAVNVTSLFIPRGPVVHIADGSGSRETLNTHPFFRFQDIPLVVLVNPGSASGSEIVAAAIQEHGTGTILGMTTFGKGTVQSIIPLPDGSGLRLTTAKYYTSKENSIHETGIEPDIYVEDEGDLEYDHQLQAAIKYLLEGELPEAG